MLQHEEKQRRELLKDLRPQAFVKSQSQWPGKWKGRPLRGNADASGSSHPTENVCPAAVYPLALPVSSSARRTKPASVHEDEDAESTPSHPRQIDGEDDVIDDREYSEPVLTISDVNDDDSDVGRSSL